MLFTPHESAFSGSLFCPALSILWSHTHRLRWETRKEIRRLCQLCTHHTKVMRVKCLNLLRVFIFLCWASSLPPIHKGGGKPLWRGHLRCSLSLKCNYFNYFINQVQRIWSTQMYANLRGQVCGKVPPSSYFLLPPHKQGLQMFSSALYSFVPVWLWPLLPTDSFLSNFVFSWAFDPVLWLLQ